MLTKFLSVVFQGISVFTAVLFSFGYAFFYGYYWRFNLDPATLAPPLWSFLVAGTSGLIFFVLDAEVFVGGVATRHAIAVVIGFIFLFALAMVWNTFWFRSAFARLQAKREPKRPTAETASSKAMVRLSWTVFPFLLFWGLVCISMFSKGGSMAERRMKQPEVTIQLFFKLGEDKGFPQDLLSANTSHNLIPLVQTKDLVVVFVRNEKPPTTFVVPRSNLQAVKLTPEPQSEKAGKRSS